MAYSHPPQLNQPLSLHDCVRAARFEEVEVAEAMALAAARDLLARGARGSAASLLSAVERVLPTYEAAALRDLLADLWEQLGELHGALEQAGIVDGQQGTAQSALRVGRLKLALGRLAGARHDLLRARDWAHAMGDLEVAHAVRPLLSTTAHAQESAPSPAHSY